MGSPTVGDGRSLDFFEDLRLLHGRYPTRQVSANRAGSCRARGLLGARDLRRSRRRERSPKAWGTTPRDGGNDIP